MRAFLGMVEMIMIMTHLSFGYHIVRLLVYVLVIDIRSRWMFKC